MKKLLLLTSLWVIFAFASCQNTRKPEQENNSETKLMGTDSISATDTTKTKGQTETSGVVGTGNGISKDTNSTQQNNNAIIHHAPNQAEIDSIKNAKLKGKK